MGATKNFGPNTEENELFMIETVMACSGTVTELKRSGIVSKTRLFEDSRQFNKAFTRLFESASGIRHTGKYSQNVPQLINFRNNRYAYFREVSDMLYEHSENEPESMKLLNESIVNLSGGNEFDFEKFRSDLTDCIKELEKVDDFKKYDSCMPEVLRTKVLARKPLYVLGFDVVNSPVLREELKTSCKLNIDDAFGILWDRTNRQLLFPFKARLITYDVERNRFGDFNEVNADNVVDPFTGDKLQMRYVEKLEKDNYRRLIADQVNHNMVQIWFNFDAMNLKYTDNLFGDKSREKFLEENRGYSDKNHIVKQPSVDVPFRVIDEPKR